MERYRSPVLATPWRPFLFSIYLRNLCPTRARGARHIQPHLLFPPFSGSDGGTVAFLSLLSSFYFFFKPLFKIQIKYLHKFGRARYYNETGERTKVSFWQSKGMWVWQKKIKIKVCSQSIQGIPCIETFLLVAYFLSIFLFFMLRLRPVCLSLGIVFRNFDFLSQFVDIHYFCWLFSGFFFCYFCVCLAAAN